MPEEIVLDDLNSQEVEDLCLSIRPTSGGQTFAISHKDRPQVYLYRGFMAQSPNITSEGKGMEELFYAHDFLSLPYHRVHYLYTPHALCLLPKAFYQHAPDQAWLSSIISPREAGSSAAYLAHTLEDENKVLLTASPLELYQFLGRMHPRLDATPYMWQQLSADLIESRRTMGHQLYLYLDELRIDAYCLCQGQTQFINSFSLVSTPDANKMAGQVQFYLFALWQSLALDGELDTLHIYICGETEPTRLALLEETCQLLQPRLESYIRQRSYSVFYAIARG